MKKTLIGIGSICLRNALEAHLKSAEEERGRLVASVTAGVGSCVYAEE